MILTTNIIIVRPYDMGREFETLAIYYLQLDEDEWNEKEWGEIFSKETKREIFIDGKDVNIFRASHKWLKYGDADKLVEYLEKKTEGMQTEYIHPLVAMLKELLRFGGQINVVDYRCLGG